MLLRTALLISLVCLALQACSSPKMAEELEQGRLSYNAGDFKQSFYQLLPVAMEGRPDAEYAVGYMYYYGYGVARDCEAGICWMSKAARKGYIPAINALNMIRARSLQPQPVQAIPPKVMAAPPSYRPVYKRELVKPVPSQDEVMQSLIAP